MRFKLIFVFLILGSCSNPSKKGNDVVGRILTPESFSKLKNEYVSLNDSDGYIVTFINGDCAYCIDRIPSYEYMVEEFNTVGLNFIAFIYSENNFYSLDTCMLRKKHGTIPIVYDEYNFFQIKNKLPAYAKEYSIYVNMDREIVDIGKPNKILNRYTNKWW